MFNNFLYKFNSKLKFLHTAYNPELLDLSTPHEAFSTHHPEHQKQCKWLRWNLLFAVFCLRSLLWWSLAWLLALSGSLIRLSLFYTSPSPCVLSSLLLSSRASVHISVSSTEHWCHHVLLECEILLRQEIWGWETDVRVDIITSFEVQLNICWAEDYSKFLFLISYF